jgi:hypothetical protein
MIEDWKVIFTHITQILVSIYSALSLFVGQLWRLIKEGRSVDSLDLVTIEVSESDCRRIQHVDIVVSLNVHMCGW